MREITYKGKKAYITEAEWKSLLKRFDVGRAEKYLSEFQLRVPCILCSKYMKYKRCQPCPLFVFRHCGELIGSITKAKSFEIDYNELRWLITDDKRARTAITKIRNALLALPRVNRRPA